LFEQEREHCQRAPLASALMMIDIDWFKKVNDQYGHIVGDEVLIGLTHMLKQALRKNDIAGRIGGEEFAVILPSSSTEQAMDAAERFRSYVQRTGIPTQAGELHITISIGVTMFQRRDVTITEILKRADDAMYASKQNGRNRVTLG
jgi:diguanylate cyclase (GGDEF)-like protein